MHPHQSSKDIAFFENLKAKVMKQNSIPNMFKKGITMAKEGMVASYNISKLIAKDGKPHSIGETLILPAITEVISTVMNQNAAEIIKSIPLNDIVARRIEEMVNDVEIQLIQILLTTEFSLQLDESTLCDNEALLLAYYNNNITLSNIIACSTDGAPSMIGCY